MSNYTSNILNKKLLKSQRVSKAQVATLLELYEELNQLFTRASEAESDEHCKLIVEELRDLEFKLQVNWNFQPNEDKHTYKFKLPGCLCPKSDNNERFGTPYKIINCSCKFHGHPTV